MHGDLAASGLVNSHGPRQRPCGTIAAVVASSDRFLAPACARRQGAGRQTLAVSMQLVEREGNVFEDDRMIRMACAQWRDHPTLALNRGMPRSAFSSCKPVKILPLTAGFSLGGQAGFQRTAGAGRRRTHLVARPDQRVNQRGRDAGDQGQGHEEARTLPPFADVRINPSRHQEVADHTAQKYESQQSGHAVENRHAHGVWGGCRRRGAGGLRVGQFGSPEFPNAANAAPARRSPRGATGWAFPSRASRARPAKKHRLDVRFFIEGLRI